MPQLSGIWRFEVEQPIPVTLPVDDQIEQLYQFAYLAECNNAMSRMYGYDSADQILGARLGDLMPQSNPKNIEYLRAVALSGYNLNDVESHDLDRYGNDKVVLNNLSAIVENGMIVRAWGTQRDITAQKQAEEALRASEERYRLLTELSPDGLVVAGADESIHLANPSVLRMLGASAEDVTGRNFFDFVAPEFHDHCSAFMKADCKLFPPPPGTANLLSGAQLRLCCPDRPRLEYEEPFLCWLRHSIYHGRSLPRSI